MRKAMTPPRKPRGEAPSVTIGNLELQVRNLTARCESLLRERDIASNEAARARQDRNEALGQGQHSFIELRNARAELEACQAKLASTERRFEGYRMHVRDTVLPFEIEK